MTLEQQVWLDKNPIYMATGRPRLGCWFTKCGTLYADGRFELSAPMKPIRIEPGCLSVGIRGAVADMLDALKHAKMCVPFPSDAHTKIVAAITKAEGDAS